MCSTLGGIAMQEVVKAVTHHMTPLKQFLYFDMSEMPPDQDELDIQPVRGP